MVTRPADGPIRVLLVDDDEDDFVLTRDMLQELDGQRPRISWAPSYEAGLEALRRREHDLCLLDYRLGGRTGLELLREAVAHGITIPIVMLTGQGDREVDRQAMASGAADYLAKGSIDALLLERCIRYALGRAQVLEALRERERQFRAVFDHNFDAMLLTGPDGHCIDANEAACQLFGRSRAQLVGAALGALDIRGPGGARWPDWAALLGAGSAEGDCQLQRSDGQRRLVSWRASPHLLRDRHLFVLHDVTEREQMRMKVALSDRMASLGTLAAGVAHEINNPLAFVVGNLEYAGREVARAQAGEPLADPTEVGQALADALAGAERVRVIVQGMHRFSRVDHDRREPLQLEPVAALAARMAHTEIRHRARLVTETAPAPAVSANEARLGQVVLNLLVNAAQAIPDGHADQHRIVLRTGTAADGRALLEVSDTGEGIPRQHLPRIFDPFFTTKPVGRGTGLGLAICHGIVSSYGGEIQVESEEGRGSTFRVLLPPAAGPRPAPPPPASVAALPKALRLLVVDDEPAIGRALQRMLGDCDVEALQDAREALRRLAAGPGYDVVLCDVMMPEMSGAVFYDELVRSVPQYRGRLALLTGGAFTSEARRFLDTAACPVLEKPLDAGLLTKTIARLAQR